MEIYNRTYLYLIGEGNMEWDRRIVSIAKNKLIILVKIQNLTNTFKPFL